MKPEEYGERFHDHLIEQYKVYVEMADRVSIRRAQTNRFYISLLSGLIALLSFVSSRGVSIISIATNEDTSYNIVTLVFSLLGLVLCFVWIINIHSYGQLNSAKFKVVHEIEQHLPFPCYDKEWEVLGSGK